MTQPQTKDKTSMKRFYKMVSSTLTDDGHAIQLDGKTVKTQAGLELCAPTKALADQVIAEWSAQDETIKPETMVLTQMLNTAIDRARDREDITNQLLKYLDTDLLCYRAKEPEEVAKTQKELWDPWLSWFDEHFESPLESTYKLEALKQDPDTHKRIWNYIEALDEYYFAVLHIITSLSGSIVLALAFLEHEATPEDVFKSMNAEEDHRARIYREDVHGYAPHEEKRRANAKAELDAAQRFMDLVDQD